MLTHQISKLAIPARVIVLGARGFVASNLIHHLSDQQIPVVGLSSDDLDLTASSSASTLAELLREDDSLVFISALTPDRGRDIKTMMKNFVMGQSVCDALVRRPCAHVIYLSTDAVYTDEATLVSEQSCAQPTSFHGTMHIVRERMLVETLKATSTPLALLRPSLLFGPGDTHNGYGPNRFVRTALDSKKVALFGGGEEKRDHVYIDDVSILTAQVLAHRSAGVLNLATGESTSFREVADCVAALVHGTEVQPSPRANPITHRHFDISALVAAFPDFRFTNFRVGLERMVEKATAV